MVVLNPARAFIPLLIKPWLQFVQDRHRSTQHVLAQRLMQQLPHIRGQRLRAPSGRFRLGVLEPISHSSIFNGLLDAHKCGWTLGVVLL